MNVFNNVGGLKPHLSFFNLSHDKKFDCDAGQLIPVFSRLFMPGDFVQISVESVVRMQPTLAPILHEVNQHFYFFFVPHRLLFGESVVKNGPKGTETTYEIADHDFETFITGGRTGDDTSVSLPQWIPTGSDVINANWNGIASGSSGSNADDVNVTVKDNGIYSLWDYLGYPTGVIPAGAYPLAFKKRAYNFIWNTYFRDPTLQDEVDIDSNIVLNSCWKKDYFTSALLWPQRGTAPGLPISGTLPVTLSGLGFSPLTLGGSWSKFSDVSSSNQFSWGSENNLPPDFKGIIFETGGGTVISSVGDLLGSKDDPGNIGNYRSVGVNVAGLSGTANAGYATTFDVNDLRLAFQIQKWLERNMRSGYYYTDFLKAHFGVSPRDERLQRPEYIGGTKMPLIVSEVLQTSASDPDPESGVTPQGNLAGHGLIADRGYIGKYHVQEFGYIIGLMTIRPKSTYQQGIDKEDLYRTKYDFPFMEFSHLGEQEVGLAEIYAQNSGNVDGSGNPVLFGYQGRYNELRSAHSVVCGGLRSTLNYWHEGRIFDSVPSLNGDFVKCNPSKRIFAVQDEPGFICNVANIVKAFRPLPASPEPGLIDHN